MLKEAMEPSPAQMLPVTGIIGAWTVKALLTRRGTGELQNTLQWSTNPWEGEGD